MRNQDVRKYRIIIAALVAVIILQWIFIPAKPKKAVKVAVKPVKLKGKIAIVLDDWGYNLNNLGMLDEIKQPFTASVLPNLSYSRQIAEELHQRGLEIILHLPMEPHEKYRLEKNTLMVSMNTAEIMGILERDLDNVKYAKGVSNHMGSRATEESRIMEVIFKELKKRHLYFLDSFVSAKTVGSILTRSMQLDFARRDVFLDNQEDPAYIRGQMNKLKMKAKAYGAAIGVGHDRRVTLKVLKEMLPQIEKEGYKFVFVSELVR